MRRLVRDFGCRIAGSLWPAAVMIAAVFGLRPALPFAHAQAKIPDKLKG